jgi:hypothetical protein
MERLLSAAGAAEETREVRSLRLDVAPAAGTAAPPGDLPVRQAGRPVPPRREPGTASWSRVTRADIIRAMEEYDRLGQDRFLADYGFGRATAYLLIHDGRSYDSKAILGVAYKFATGVRIGSHDFSGGIYGAAAVLTKLGFEIRNVRNPARQP